MLEYHPNLSLSYNCYSDVTLNCSVTFDNQLFNSDPSVQVVNNFYYLNGSYPAGISNANVTQFNDLNALQSQVNSTFDQMSNFWVGEIMILALRIPFEKLVDLKGCTWI